MKGKMAAMDNNYKEYVQKYQSIDNPETKTLLIQIREALKNSDACIKILDIFNSELEGTYTERLAKLHNYVIQEPFYLRAAYFSAGFRLSSDLLHRERA